MTFDEAFSLDSVQQEFSRLSQLRFDYVRNRVRISTGSDKVDYVLFKNQQGLHLQTASRRCLNGRYQFSAFLEVDVPKPGKAGAFRTISIATIQDTVVQRCLYSYLYDAVDSQLLDSAVFGYRKRKSARLAVSTLREVIANGQHFVFDADLSKFFDSINHDLLINKIESLRIDDRAKKMLRRFLKSNRVESSEVLRHRSLATGVHERYRKLSRSCGVPQGGVLSGMLANLYLSNLDKELSIGGRRVVRYADDFVVCCSSEVECEATKLECESHLKILRIHLNPDKTRSCVDARRGITFLGCTISPDSIRVSKGNKERFKHRIVELVKRQWIGPSSQKTINKLIRRVAYKVRGPSRDELKRIAALNGRSPNYATRCWAGAFRNVTELDDLKELDLWVRSALSKWAWTKYQYRLRLSEMRRFGLPSLVNTLFRSRAKPKRSEKRGEVI